MKSTTRLAAIAICAAVFGVFLASAANSQSVPYASECQGTSECSGNLSCHKSNFLSVNGLCRCPVRGDGSYKLSHGQPECWGIRVPKKKCWKDGQGAERVIGSGQPPREKSPACATAIDFNY